MKVRVDCVFGQFCPFPVLSSQMSCAHRSKRAEKGKTKGSKPEKGVKGAKTGTKLGVTAKKVRFAATRATHDYPTHTDGKFL